MRRHALSIASIFVFAATLSIVTMLAGSNASVAQFPFPNPLGNPQDIAVRAALSEFGKAVGDQLPIVLTRRCADDA